MGTLFKKKKKKNLKLANKLKSYLKDSRSPHPYFSIKQSRPGKVFLFSRVNEPQGA